MTSPISFLDFVRRAQQAGSTTTGRKPLTLLHIPVNNHTAESRWQSKHQLLCLSDGDIVVYLAALLNDIEARGIDAEGNDRVRSIQMSSLRALMERFKGIIVEHSLDFQGRNGVSCKHVMARVHQVLPEFALELEEAERQRNPANYEPAT